MKIKGLVYVQVGIYFVGVSAMYSAKRLDATLDDNSIKRSDSINRPVLNPLYRGTWFSTEDVNIPGVENIKGFHPLYRGTWFPTLPEKHPL